MEIFNFYTAISSGIGVINFKKKHMTGDVYPLLDWKLLVISLAVAGAIWLGLFLLQSFGLYTMAKRRGIKHRWMAFVPFINWILVEKLSGDCIVFGRRVRKLGLMTMIAQILVFLLCAFLCYVEIYLYYNHGTPSLVDEKLVWQTLTSGDKKLLSAYDIISTISSIVQFIYILLMLLLVYNLLKCYNPARATMWAILISFIPIIRYILLFVYRKKEAIDYNEYVRKKREEAFRMWQQYASGGGVPSTPSTHDDTEPSVEPQEPKEEPFAEFSTSEEGDASSSTDQSDDFFA